LIDFFGPERAVTVSRELSKMYEETFRGTLIEAIEYFSLHIPKGEFVICLEGAQKNNR
jgi:16S rRNA (cytidine1402-2'-O)-methyltransferase